MFQDPRVELLSFHKQHYSASVMSLCLVGKEPLDELEQMVRQRFSEVPANERKRFR